MSRAYFRSEFGRSVNTSESCPCRPGIQSGLRLRCGRCLCKAPRLFRTHGSSNLRGLTARKVKVILDGGELGIEWRESDDHVLMSGPIRFSFAGEVNLPTLVAES